MASFFIGDISGYFYIDSGVIDLRVNLCKAFDISESIAEDIATAIYTDYNHCTSLS